MAQSARKSTAGKSSKVHIPAQDHGPPLCIGQGHGAGMIALGGRWERRGGREEEGGVGEEIGRRGERERREEGEGREEGREPTFIKAVFKGEPYNFA